MFLSADLFWERFRGVTTSSCRISSRLGGARRVGWAIGTGRDTHAQAIDYVCARIIAAELEWGIPENEIVFRRWTPNQLRFNCVMMVGREFYLETSQVVLGHTRANVTEIYAAWDRQRAMAAMLKVG